MSRVVPEASREVTTAELQAALERALGEHDFRPVGIVHMDRRLSEYRSSFAIEELDVQLENDLGLRLIWKDSGRRALSADAIHAKPLFLYDPLREIETYRLILGPCEFGTPRCFGTVINREADRFWLFLERVSGLELTREGDLACWQEAARWLARFHDHFASNPLSPTQRERLLIHDRRFFELWIGRAREFLRQREPAVAAAELKCIDRLADQYDRVVARLMELPVSLVHGDFFASNILVDRTPSTPRICPVDWELSAIGPRWLDLAALVAGHWTDEERRSMVLAYFEESTAHGLEDDEARDFLLGLRFCRLHLAVQMLGWSATWRPQPVHDHDWLSEAIQLAVELQLV